MPKGVCNGNLEKKYCATKNKNIAFSFKNVVKSRLEDKFKRI